MLIHYFTSVFLLLISITGIYFLALYKLNIISNLKLVFGNYNTVGLIIDGGDPIRKMYFYGGWFVFMFDVKRY